MRCGIGCSTRGSRDLLVRAERAAPAGQPRSADGTGRRGWQGGDRQAAHDGLLTEIREPKAGGGWTFSYEVHPLVGRLAAQRSDRAEALREEGHRRAGDHLEQQARTSPSWQDNLEAAYHLRQVGEADRSLRSSGAARAVAAAARPHAGCARRSRRHRRSGVAASLPGGVGAAPSPATRRSPTATLPRRSPPTAASLAIRERLAAADPSNAGWQRDLSVSHNKRRRRAAGAGPARRRAHRLPGEPGHRRAAGGGRSEQRRLAARPVGQPRQASATCCRRRAGSTTRSPPTGRAWPSASGWRRPIRATPAGSATCRSATTSSATCCGRRGGSTTRSPPTAPSLAIARAAGGGRSEQRRLAARPVGQPQQASATCCVAQGQLDDALAAYRASLAIRERLAAADPSNAGWQRDLSVSHNKRRRRAAWRRGGSTTRSPPTGRAWPSPSGWRRPIRATPAGSATCRSATTRLGDVLQAQGRLDDALTAYRASLAIRERLAAADPQQRRLAARPVGQPRQRRRRAAGAGAARRRARRLPRRAWRIARAAGGGRSEQRRLAARPVRLVRQTGQRPGAVGDHAAAAESGRRGSSGN